MKFFLFALSLFFLFILQIGVLPHFLIFGLSINLLLISAFIFAFFMMNYWELMIFSFAAGFLLDVYSGVPFGIILLSFVLSVILVNFLAYNFLGRENIFVVCIGAAIGFVTYFAIYFIAWRLYGFFGLSSGMGVGTIVFLKVDVFSAVLNTVGVAVLYGSLKKFAVFIDNFKG